MLLEQLSAIPLLSLVRQASPLQAALVTAFVAATAFWVWIFDWPGSKVELHPMRASNFSPAQVPTDLDTIVVGSGSGGCAAANLLAQSGQRVLLLEQHYRTGGCTHTFREEGCEWDTGLHYTAASMGQATSRPGALLRFMTHGLQQWTPLEDPYDQVLFPADDNVAAGKPNSNKYSFLTGIDATVDSILTDIDPSNKSLRKRMIVYMNLCQRINDGFTALGSEYTNIPHKHVSFCYVDLLDASLTYPYLSPSLLYTLAVSRILPAWMHFIVKKPVDQLMKFASMTVRDVQYAIFNLGYSADELLQHGCPEAPAGPEPDPSLRRLKAVLTHPIGDYAVQPRDATMAAHGVTMAHYAEGACYSVGPTQQISIRSSSMVRATGGEVLTDATVCSIMVENGRAMGVRVSNTTALAEAAENHDSVAVMEIRAKNIVFASSIYNLYNKLLPKDMPQVKDFQDPTKRTVRQSNGHLFLFCKLKGDAAELELPNNNLWYFNGYDLDEAFDKYFANPREVRPPTVYIGFPCTKDTAWKKRYPNVSNCILISDGLWEWFEKWQDNPVHNRGADYEAFKETLSKHLLDILYETLPQIKGKLEFHMLGTPLSEVTYLGSWHGGSYGTMCKTSMFDEKNRHWTTTPHTTIPGLYLAGSDAFLPAVCGAMYGGCFGASAVLGHTRTVKLTMNFMKHFAADIKKENPKMSWIEAYRTAWYRFINE